MSDKNDFKIKPDYYGAINSKNEQNDLLALYESGLCNSVDFFTDFSLGNAIKYLIRFKQKHGINDLEKSKEYLYRVCQSYDKDPFKHRRQFNSDSYGDKLNLFNKWYSSQKDYSDKTTSIINLIIAYTFDFDKEKLLLAIDKIKRLEEDINEEATC